MGNKNGKKSISDAPDKNLFLEACDFDDLDQVRHSLGLGANVNWRRACDGASGLHLAGVGLGLDSHHRPVGRDAMAREMLSHCPMLCKATTPTSA